MGSSDRDEDALAATEAPRIGSGLDATTPASESAPPGEVASLAAGTRVGRYVLDETLGAGGMGVVYRAHDPELDRSLAVKLVRTAGGGSTGRTRLVREAQAMAKLRHPNVMPIFDVGTRGRDVYVVMPLLEGGTLGAWARERPRPWREVVDRYLAAGRGLAAAHAAGLIHRDFKPENVMLGAEGEVQVADFGLARVDREEAAPARPPSAIASLELTRTGDLLGTPAYMAPEQLRGEPSDARADQFAFCVALWEGLYGERPFSAGDARGHAALRALVAAIEAGTIAPGAPGRDVPPWLRVILLRGLAAKPGDRWPSMTALLDRIAAQRGRRRGRTAIVAAVATAALVAVVAVLVAGSGGGARGTTRYRIEPVTQRGDVTDAALSPDGRRIAFLAGESVVVRDVAAGAEDLVLRTGVSTSSDLAWAPDGRRLLADAPGDSNVLEVIDVDTGAGEVLPIRAGYYAFTGEDELVAGLFGNRRVQFHSVRNAGAIVGECEIPGDFEWPRAVKVSPADRVLVFAVADRALRQYLQIIDRDCRHLGTIALPAGVETYAVSAERHSVLVLESGAGAAEVIEYSLTGRELGRERLPAGGDMALIGRQGGRHYFLDAETKTTLLRAGTGGDRTVIASATVPTRYAVAPDSATVAWIEEGDGEAGPLRIAPLEKLRVRTPPIHDAAARAGWSADGKRLAVTVRGADGFGLAVVDPATGAARTVITDPLSKSSAPVWLDASRVVFPLADNQSFGWVDVDSGERGTALDLELGWVFYPCGLGDGSLLFVLNQRGGKGKQLWRLPPGGDAIVTPVVWGVMEALVCTSSHAVAFDNVTGTVDQVEPATGARTRLAAAPLVPPQRLGDVTLLAGGDLLFTIQEQITDILVAVPE